MWSFWGNKKRYYNTIGRLGVKKSIVTSNISCDQIDGRQYVVNYNQLVHKEYTYYENSVMMLITLLLKLGVKGIKLAGVDGFNEQKDNYIDSSFQNFRHVEDYDLINAEIGDYLKNIILSYPRGLISFITPSIFEKYLEVDDV